MTLASIIGNPIPLGADNSRGIAWHICSGCPKQCRGIVGVLKHQSLETPSLSGLGIAGHSLAYLQCCPKKCLGIVRVLIPCPKWPWNLHLLAGISARVSWQCRAYIRDSERERSISPLFPGPEGDVVAYDWCLIGSNDLDFIITPAYSKVGYRGSTFRPFVQSSVCLSVRPSTIHVKVLYSVAVIAGSMKPCIVITLDTLFKQAPWPGALDLHFTLHWLCQNFASSLENLRRV